MIEINNKWAIGADELNIILYRSHTSRQNDKTIWAVNGYYSSLHNVYRALVSQEVRDTQLASLKTVLTKLDEIEALIKNMPQVTLTTLANEVIQNKRVMTPEHIAKIKASRSKTKIPTG